MTTVAAILASTRAAGVRVATDGHNLILRAPAAPPEAVIAALRAHKPALIAALTAPVPLDASGLPFSPCPRCGARDFWRASIVAAGDAFDPLAWRCGGCERPPKGAFTDGCSIPQQAPGLRVLGHAAPRQPCRQSSEVRSATP